MFIFQAGNFCTVEKRAIKSVINDTGTSSIAYDKIERQLVEGKTPIGTVEFCRKVMALTDTQEPPNISYPACLVSYLKRDINIMDALDVPVGWFIKPCKAVKDFDGHIKTPDEKISGVVYASKPVMFGAEWRYYVMAGNILGNSRYDDFDELYPEPNDFVMSIIRNYIGQPSAYAIDVGIMQSSDMGANNVVLVEINDAWALGYYPWGTMSAKAYTDMIVTRWNEITAPPQK